MGGWGDDSIVMKGAGSVVTGAVGGTLGRWVGGVTIV